MKRISYISTLFFLLIAVSSCKKSFFDVNSNPNLTPSASYQLVLPAALNSIGANVTDGLDYTKYWMGIWAVSGGYAPNITEVTYKFSNAYHQEVWSNFYYAINNLNYVENAANASNDKFYAGIAKAMKVYCYHNLVDLYGNVPYSQALQIDKYPRPKYDSAATIYASLFKQLDSARTLIASWNGQTEAPSKSSDIIYHGEQTLWIKFINTLELRLLLRFADIAKPSYYATELNIVKGDSRGFLVEGEDALVNPGYSNALNDNLNPFYADYGFNAAGNQATNYGYYRANSYGVDFYSNTNDPRIEYFYAPYATGKYAGNDFGIQGNPNNVTSGIGLATSTRLGIINSPSQSSPVLTSFESLFLQAEAAQRGLIVGDYKALYKSALEESFYYCGITDATAASTYYGQASDLVNIDSSATPLTTILTQKWASINAINPLEVYADYRRTKIPADIPGSKAAGVGPIPSRLLYPQSEINTNPDNVSAQGTITLNSKIFWVK